MSNIYVQFNDAEKTSIVSLFNIPQDSIAGPCQGVVDTSDPRYAAYWKAIPDLMRQYLPRPD